MSKVRVLLALVATLVASNEVGAQRRIGNWNGSGRSWNNSDMLTVRTTMTGRGHSVFADADITGANLLNYDVFIIGEGTRNVTGAEATALASWVSGGGRLVTLWDSGNSGNPFNNNIMTALGLALQGSGSAGGSTTLAGGNFATNGGPFNIVGQALNTTPGTAISGGSALASDWLRFQGLGSGVAFAFADRSDHGVFSPNASTTNGQLFINIVEAGSINVVPEPSTYLLMVSGLVGLLMIARARAKHTS